MSKNNETHFTVYTKPTCVQCDATKRRITQFGGTVFDTCGLNIIDWLKVFAMALSIIVVAEVIKLILRLAAKKKAK